MEMMAQLTIPLSIATGSLMIICGMLAFRYFSVLKKLREMQQFKYQSRLDYDSYFELKVIEHLQENTTELAIAKGAQDVIDLINNILQPDQFAKRKYEKIRIEKMSEAVRLAKENNFNSVADATKKVG